MTRKEYNDNIQQWSGHVLRYAVWHCGDDMRGEDAMQEAFAELWQKRDRVEVAQGLGFLLTVVRRYLIDCYRHDEVTHRVHDELRHREEADHTMERSMMLGDALQQALQKLPEVQRDILLLRDAEGYSYKEIAAMLQLSQQKVEVYLFRARVAMRKMLAAIKD